MSAPLLPWPRAKFFAPNTNYPLAGGKVYSYAAGTNTPLATYTDAGGLTPNANPVILDANGEASIYLAAGAAYKINVTDASGVGLPGYPIDNIIGADPSGAADQLRADLANTSDVAKGDAMIGVKQPLTNAVARTQHDVNAEYISLLDFYAITDGNDYSPALTRALAVSGNIKFPGQKLTFASKVSYTFPVSASGPSDDKNTFGSINLVGAGQDLTILYFPNSSGIEITCGSFQQTVHIRDLSITTGQANGGTAIKLINRFAFFGSYTAQHDFDRVTFRGDDGYGAVYYWTECVNLFNITAINFDACSWYGPVLAATANTYGRGVVISSSRDPGIAHSTTPGCATTFNFVNNNMVFLGRAIEVGTLCQAFKVTNTQILNGYDGIYILPGLEEIRQFTVTGSEISVNGDVVFFGTATPSCTFEGNYIATGSGKSGIIFNTDTGAPNGGGSTVIGNTFNALTVGAANGIFVKTTFMPITIEGNTFNGWINGIGLEAGSSGAKIAGNNYSNCTNNILDASTPGSHFIALDEPVAWTAYTVPATAGSGTFTSASATGRYHKTGKTVVYRARITITTIGTGTQDIRWKVPLDIQFQGTTAMFGRESSATNTLCSVACSGDTLIMTRYDGVFIGASGYTFDISGSYETV